MTTPEKTTKVGMEAAEAWRARQVQETEAYRTLVNHKKELFESIINGTEKPDRANARMAVYQATLETPVTPDTSKTLADIMAEPGFKLAESAKLTKVTEIVNEQLRNIVYGVSARINAQGPDIAAPFGLRVDESREQAMLMRGKEQGDSVLGMVKKTAEQFLDKSNPTNRKAIRQIRSGIFNLRRVTGGLDPAQAGKNATPSSPEVMLDRCVDAILPPKNREMTAGVVVNEVIPAAQDVAKEVPGARKRLHLAVQNLHQVERGAEIDPTFGSLSPDQKKQYGLDKHGLEFLGLRSIDQSTARMIADMGLDREDHAMYQAAGEDREATIAKHIHKNLGPSKLERLAETEAILEMAAERMPDKTSRAMEAAELRTVEAEREHPFHSERARENFKQAKARRELEGSLGINRQALTWQRANPEVALAKAINKSAEIAAEVPTAQADQIQSR